MITLDKLLIKILNSPKEELTHVPHREIKILKSLGKLVSTSNFVTENQGKLLVKILGENLSNFGNLSNEISEAILLPQWSRPFRVIDKTKKLYMSEDNSCIVLEFAFSSSLRKTLQEMWRTLGSVNTGSSGRTHLIELTEQNVVSLVETFQPLGFEIDEKIENFYKTIKSWSEEAVKNQFLLENIEHANFQKHITKDLGIDTEVSKTIIIDRSVRYQYFLKNYEKTPENLTEIIAYRKNSKVWVNKNNYTLEEIFSSLKQLQRLPALVIFDHNDHKKCLEDLKNLQKSLEKNEIIEGVGIYFRLDNDDVGSQFNKLIAEAGYNSQLDKDTKIVGVQNGKIPKFFLKSDWKPMSVISIGSSLKQTKTAVYANCCDLIISYTEQQPIIEHRVLWE